MDVGKTSPWATTKLNTVGKFYLFQKLIHLDSAYGIFQFSEKYYYYLHLDFANTINVQAAKPVRKNVIPVSDNNNESDAFNIAC